eukprot:evm.model.scf_472.3 EVM.evm.TU.scf_472.3   scf_472:26701-32391(+)
MWKAAALALAIFCCLWAASRGGRDYYDLLSVPRAASQDQIKRAYKKLALTHHPDKVKGSKEDKERAAQKFQEISSAYEVLSDPEQRQIYDRYGEEGLKQRSGGGGGSASDIFKTFFGGFGGFGFNEEEEDQVRKGNDVYSEVDVTLADLYVGKEIKVVRDKNVIKPAAGTRSCNCRQQLVTQQLGPGMFQQYSKQVCEQCPNVKYVRESEVLTVRVEPGMKHEQEISFFEEGEPAIDGEPGDLKFVLNELPNELFVRDGNNLWHNTSISLVEALCGFSKEITHLDGHKVVLSSNEVTRPGQVRQIPKEGMPLLDDELNHGSLFVTYTVDFPQQLTEDQKASVKQTFSLPTV